MAYHEKGVIRSRANNSDFDPVLGIPLRRLIRDLEYRNGSRGKTYTGIAIENVHIIPGIQVIYGTFAVDLESVCLNSQDCSLSAQ